MLKNKLLKAGAVAGAVLGATAANASVVTAEVIGALDGITADLTTVGGIMIGLAAVAVSFKWVKRAIFGL
jgi:hypothetical protein